RAVFLEAGAGWAPYWLWRMDEHWENADEARLADGSGRLPRRPGDYFRRQCFISAEPDEPFLPATIAYLGGDPLVFATDSPHPASRCRDAVRAFRERPGLTEATRHKILWENPSRLYGRPAAG